MWKQTQFAARSHFRSTLVGKDRYWVAHTGKRIYGIDGDSGDIIWDSPNGTCFTAYESGVCIDQVAVFCHYPDKNNKRVILRGFNIADGGVLWEREKTHPYCGCGLLTDGRWLIYSDLREDGKQYLIYADATTGETIHSVRAGMNIHAGTVSQVGPKLVSVCEGVLYLKSRTDEKLYMAPVTEEAAGVVRVDEVESDVLMLDSDRRHVFVSVSEGKDQTGIPRRAVLRLDGPTGKVLKRIAHPHIRSLNRSTALSSPRGDLVALHFVDGNKGQGLMLVDFERDKVLWHRGQEEEWYVSHAEGTPHDLIATIYESKASRKYLVRLDIETGEILPFPEIEGSVESNARWNGRQLIVDTLRGWRIFEWVEGGEADVESTVVSSTELATGPPEPDVLSRESTPLEKMQAAALVQVDPETPPTETDLLLNRVVQAFLDCMSSQKAPEVFDAKTEVFQKLARQMFEEHPETGSETIVAGLVQMGVPLPVAQKDVLALLFRSSSEKSKA